VKSLQKSNDDLISENSKLRKYIKKMKDKMSTRDSMIETPI